MERSLALEVVLHHGYTSHSSTTALNWCCPSQLYMVTESTKGLACRAAILWFSYNMLQLDAVKPKWSKKAKWHTGRFIQVCATCVGRGGVLSFVDLMEEPCRQKAVSKTPFRKSLRVFLQPAAYS